jgi:hypothetical protein
MDHYNELIRAGEIPELNVNDTTQPRLRLLESLDAPWPEDLRQPTMIISGIPRQAADQGPTNFSLPEEWLKSPTGGVVLEVSYDGRRLQ